MIKNIQAICHSDKQSNSIKPHLNIKIDNKYILVHRLYVTTKLKIITLGVSKNGDSDEIFIKT